MEFSKEHNKYLDIDDKLKVGPKFDDYFLWPDDMKL